MSSIAKSLQTVSTTSTTTNSGIATTSLVDDSITLANEETFAISDKYTWYNQYKDENFSVIDDKKNVKIDSNQINITQEENSQVIPFQLSRYYDGVDLMEMNFRIYFVNADGNEGFATPINVTYSDTKIRFYWLVGNLETAKKGGLSFEIQATGVNELGLNYTWKTKPSKNELNILESLSGSGLIEPSDEWYTQFIRDMDTKIAQAQTAANEARTLVSEANQALDDVNTRITNVSEEIKDRVVADMETTLLQYYTKQEVDVIIENLDFSEVLEEVQRQIDAIDGLADLVVEYDNTTNKITFKNGDKEIVSHVLNTNPTAEWTTSFRSTVKTDIDEAVKIVSDELDTYKTENDENVSANTAAITNLNNTLNNNYYDKPNMDEKLSSKADSSKVSTLENNLSKVESSTETNKTNIVAVTSKITEIEERMNEFNTDPTLSYYATYNAETGLYTLYEVEGEIESVKSQFTIVAGSGGGTSTSTTVTIDRITTSPITATKNNKVIIKYNFSSIDSSGDTTDEGNATWKVGNSIVATSIALQGENEFDITNYVSVGTQKVTLTITDAAGTIAVKTWTIQVIDVRLESSFNDKYTYPMRTVSFDYIPYGSISKDVHFILDGKELGTVTTSNSGIPMSYTLPAQTHGAHLLEVYMTAVVNNTTIETNHIYKDIIWYDETSDIPVIGCISQNITAKQYDNTNIIYTVYDPKTETPKVTLAVDGKEVSSLTLDSATQTWQYKSTEVGEHILTITCGVTVKIIHVLIEELDIDVAPVTANLAFDFNPSGYSNKDENRLWTDGTTYMTVSDNFDWVNGGYQLDENGDQYFCIKAGTNAIISYNLFADDARKNGKEFKLIFKTTNVRKSNATFLTCEQTVGTTPIGLQMNVHEAYVKSSAESLYIPYCEEDIIEFDINLNKESDIPMVLHYEDGTPGRPMLYASDYSFTQTSPVPITIGSPDCDVHIYRMKAYSSSLTDSGILSNFISDARNADEMIARYNRNQIYDENNLLTPESFAKACPYLKIIKIDCPHFTNDKSDFVKNTNIECIHTGGDPVLDNWKAINCYHSGQGTTSNEYGQSGRNMDILMCFDGNYTNKKITYDESYITQLTMGDGTSIKDGTGKITLTRTSVPTNYLNIKVNIASSENENNALLQKRYNDYLPYTSVAKKKNPYVKNTMEFVDCVVFVRENDPDLTTHREFQDTEFHYYAMGNLGDSKKTDYTRVTNPNDPKEFVVEIMDNTLQNSTFPSGDKAMADLEADQFDEEMTYGLRYEYDDITDEQHEANLEIWRDFYRFVVNSTDTVFVSQLSNWFIVESALYFYLFTERYTMIDNRAKNTFWHYSKVYISQTEATAMGDDAQYYTIDDTAASINNGYRFDMWAYDHDTALGINNSGELTMTYGKEDTDYRTDGDATSGYIFNGAESTFWCRIRDLMYDQLAAMFVNRESQNCWSAEGLIAEWDEHQNNFPEEVWRLDFERKYKRTYQEGTERFLKTMMNGRKKYQRRQFERDQEKYMATKYFGNTATSDQIMFRCNTPSEAVVAPDYTLHLTPYSDMYLSVMFGATYRQKIRAKAGQQYDITCPFSTMDDTAVLIYCASRIQSLGDVSACYIHDNDFSKAEKLQELIIGNNTNGYQNVFLTNLVIGNNKLLEYLDIRNTPNLAQSLNVSGCSNLEELYAEGSGITGITFANGGKIRIAHLPSISSIIMKNLTYIEDIQIETFQNMQTIVIENTPAIDTYSYVNNSPNLTNVRLIGIDWGEDEEIKDTSILDRLLKIAGIDASGYNSAMSVLTGSFYSPIVKQKLLSDYMNAWNDLIITYDTLITQYAVTFQNYDGTILEVQYVDKGADAVDPTTRTDNPISIPTKPSDTSTDYTFSGWDLSLEGIFANRTITAQYSESVRNYTVKYMARSYVLQETIAPYGSSVAYKGDLPTYTDEEAAYVYYLFKGWDASGYVDGDKTINAIYDRFEYTDGCFDGVDISEMTPVQIYAMTKVGITSDIVEIKDSISFNMGNDYSYSDIEEKTIISEKTVLTGSNYIDTGIKLLKTDRDWIIALDYKWGTNNVNNAVLAQCYQGDGSNGFKLWYSSSPKITWGTASASSALVDKRDMLVLRHLKGETQIHVYRGNLPVDTIDYSTLNATRCIASNSTLVFGCAKADDGAYEDYAIGTIYWCKIWYSDLGDDACKNLAMWTHETINLEMTGFKRFYLSDGSGQRSSMTFLSSHLLSNTMALSGSTTNAGGWGEASLNRFLNNRFYSAIPVVWRQLIKQVKVSYLIGNKSTEIGTSNCYIAIPSVTEMDSSMQFEPYSFEGEPITFITSSATRIRKFEDGTTGEYWLRSPNNDYDTYFYSIDTDGNLTGYNYALYEKGIVLMLSI